MWIKLGIHPNSALVARQLYKNYRSRRSLVMREMSAYYVFLMNEKVLLITTWALSIIWKASGKITKKKGKKNHTQF